MRYFRKQNIFNVLTVACVFLLGFSLILLVKLYLSTFYFLNSFKEIIFDTLIVVFVSLITIFTLLFLNKKRESIFKLFILILILAIIFFLLLFFIKKLNLYAKIKSINDFRRYISSFGALAVIIFVLISFLQVVILPIPGFISIGAGVILFGPFWGSIYSSIGIIIGSILAFYIGRILGTKVVSWLIGDSALKKWNKFIKGKDKFLLTFMFIFPFFPDDILCFVAGITSLSSKFFICMTVFVRLFTIFISSYTFTNVFIPFNTWWGISLWIIILSAIIILTYIVYRKVSYMNIRK